MFYYPEKKAMFLAMRDIFYGGEFSNWLDKQENIPVAAMKEFQEAEAFFYEETGFKPKADQRISVLKP